jgi:hypothetical protein
MSTTSSLPSFPKTDKDTKISDLLQKNSGNNILAIIPSDAKCLAVRTGECIRTKSENKFIKEEGKIVEVVSGYVHKVDGQYYFTHAGEVSLEDYTRAIAVAFMDHHQYTDSAFLTVTTGKTNGGSGQISFYDSKGLPIECSKIIQDGKVNLDEINFAVTSDGKTAVVLLSRDGDEDVAFKYASRNINPQSKTIVTYIEPSSSNTTSSEVSPPANRGYRAIFLGMQVAFRNSCSNAIVSIVVLIVSSVVTGGKLDQGSLKVTIVTICITIAGSLSAGLFTQ